MLKRLLICSLAILAALGATAQPKGYFCSTKGMSLRYERYSPDNSKHWWTNTVTINDVQKNADGSLEITVSANIVPRKATPPVKGTVKTKSYLHADGTIEVNISEAAAIAAKKRFAAFNFTSSGGTSIMKATAKPGDKLEEIHAEVAWSGIKYNIDYTDRSVVKKETITVPGGTFECIVIKEHKAESAPLYKRERITYTWYALGYGMIKHDSYFLDGRQETSEQLYGIETQ
ncbi:MAG: hypothetical protein II102_05905 [Bacteroidales bacterium]|nr:hypothetical protein [Bacteroidales bacterium]